MTIKWTDATIEQDFPDRFEVGVGRFTPADARMPIYATCRYDSEYFLAAAQVAACPHIGNWTKRMWFQRKATISIGMGLSFEDVYGVEVV